jgi:ankyrin repeat protein
MTTELVKIFQQTADGNLNDAMCLAFHRRNAEPTADGREHPQDLARVERLLRDNPDALQSKEGGEGADETILHQAAEMHLPGCCELLLRLGVNVNLQGEHWGRTPLLAVFDQEFYPEDEPRMARTVEVLLNHGADPRLCSKSGKSPLQIAAGLGNGPLFDLLCGQRGELDLNSAVLAGDVERVRELLDRLDPLENAPRPGHLIKDALSVADQEAAEELLCLLLEKGLHPDTSPTPGGSPLLDAAGLWKPLPLMKLLVEHGANVNAVYEGRTALDVARQVKNPKLAALLKKAGGKSGRELLKPLPPKAPEAGTKQALTETEWLASAKPEDLLAALDRRFGGKPSPRKLRLFLVACCRRLLSAWRFQEVVDFAEAYADREVNLTRRRALLKAVAPVEADDFPAYSALELATARELPAAQAAAGAEWVIVERVGRDPEPDPKMEQERLRDWEEEKRWQAGILRDIFGNPFQPTEINVSWRKWQRGRIAKLAQKIYDRRQFDELPSLADALEQAGCTDAGMLGHCREAGEHVRGCWVVDLILGKE